MGTTKLTAVKREVTGSKVKRLRASGFVPANIYGKTTDSIAIQLADKEFQKAYDKAGDTGIIEISLDKEPRPVLVDEIQVHPVTDEILHVDFKQVNLKEKVIATVPLEFVGDAPAEKTGLVVMQQIVEVDVEALPLELPEFYEIDLSTLVDLESSITIADLPTKTGVDIQAEPEQIIANVTEPKEEEMEIVEEEELVEGEEGEEETETETEEGEEAVEESETTGEEKEE